VALVNRLVAEAVGTAWLVIGGCGSVLMVANGSWGTHAEHLSGVELLGSFPGIVAISLAFGLTVMTMAYAIGHVSGCHLNPAVTVGLVMAKRFDPKDAGPYIAAQIGGAVVGAGILFLIFQLGHSDYSSKDAFAQNGYGEHSPGQYKLVAAFVTELVMTFFFLFIILGATDARAPAGFAPIAIGLGLTLIHLISIPVTGTSVNPARSIGPAVFARGDAITQLWLFIVAPTAGAILAGLAYPFIAKPPEPT
jgi:aquaporin Z